MHRVINLLLLYSFCKAMQEPNPAKARGPDILLLQVFKLELQ